jgi:adenine-specific DNA-methyltransferase
MPQKEPELDAGKLTQIDVYKHDKHSRANIPPAGMAQYDIAASPDTAYQYDPHIDPSLQWAGKAEGTSFTVPSSSIHIHEVINPYKIIRSAQTAENTPEPQSWLFESDAERAKRRNDAIEFYQHKDKWTNRLIAGDSLVIMNSLLEKEAMAGQVQMIYIDPPYGIKYGSNFQPFVNKRDVKDKDEDLSSEPETIKAFRDTWELGIHSYLTYLRNRLLLARELLHDSGSVFVQISDENVHHVRELCDEVFGVENFVALIPFKKTSGKMGNFIDTINDYLVWYAKDKTQLKYHQLYLMKEYGGDGVTGYTKIELADGTHRSATKEEKAGILPEGARLFSEGSLKSSRPTGEGDVVEYEFEGKKYTPGKGTFKTNLNGLNNLKKANRLSATENTLCYIRYFDDFPVRQITNWWDDTIQSTFAIENIYVVQTYTKVIQRCLLMTTDPGDLVLDITCGSGTTAYVAEQWGRRWITCDTSRIAIILAKKRLMTAVFDYYKLAHPDQGVSNGFVYKTVPHITLKSIANNEPPEQETLYDQPEIEKKKVRVSGPFTVEALPAPVVTPLETTNNMNDANENIRDIRGLNYGKKLEDWMDELRASGILSRGGEKIQFSRIETLEGAKFLHAEAETKEAEGKTPRRALIFFGSETRPLDVRTVDLTLEESARQYPKPAFVIFAYFQLDPVAENVIDNANIPGVTLIKTQMNIDLMTSDLKKKSSGSQSFWLVGQPDVELIKLETTNNASANKNSENNIRDNSWFKVRVNGFDYYDVKKGVVESGGAERIALWMLDPDYDGMALEPKQVFFPMEGKNEGWDKLAKTLRAEIDQDLIEKYRGVESLPFTVKENSLIAVKIVDDRGIESLKVIPVREGA